MPTARLITLEEGRIDYHSEGQTHALQGPASIFVPVWCKRRWQSRSAVPPKVRWLSFSLPFSHLLFSKTHVINGPLPAWTSDSFERILHRWNGYPHFNPAIEAELKTLLIAFFEANPTPSLERKEPSTSGLSDVRQIIHWLENNYRDPRALTRLTGESHLNPDYFRRLFKRETGVTPGGYLSRLRMQAARYYLHETPLRINEIADRVGLEDQRYFSRQYRAFWGKSPSEERSME